MDSNDSPGKSRSSDTLILLAAIVVIGAMAAWFFLGSDKKMVEDTTITAPEPAPVAEQVETVVGSETSDSELLSRARIAAESGMLVEPAGTNALYYYSLFLEQEPDDARARDEAAALLDRIGADIDRAVAGGDFQRATFLADQIANAGFDHESTVALENALAQAAAAARETAVARASQGDEAGANAALAELESLPGVTSTDLLVVRGDVRDALDARRLAAAAAEAERRAEAERAAAAQRAAAERSARAAPSRPAPVAEAVSSASPVEPVTAALAGNDIPTALRLYLELPDDADGRADVAEALATALAGDVEAKIASGQLAEAEGALASWRAVASDATREASLQAAIDRAYIEAATAEVVSAATLKRVQALAPVYPRAALRRELTGRLRLEFTVAADGSTTDIEVVETDAGGVFDRSAVRAVSGWRYEPREVRGQQVAQRVYAYLEYSLE